MPLCTAEVSSEPANLNFHSHRAPSTAQPRSSALPLSTAQVSSAQSTQITVSTTQPLAAGREASLSSVHCRGLLRQSTPITISTTQPLAAGREASLPSVHCRDQLRQSTPITLSSTSRPRAAGREASQPSVHCTGQLSQFSQLQLQSHSALLSLWLQAERQACPLCTAQVSSVSSANSNSNHSQHYSASGYRQ